MTKIARVIWYEMVVIVFRPSFIIAVLGLPLITTLFYAGVSLLRNSNQETLTNPMSLAEEIIGGEKSRAHAQGYVDESGLIRALPSSVSSEALRAFRDEASARLALGKDEISGYYIVPQDYLASGELTYVQPEFDPLAIFKQNEPMRWVMQVNLLGGDERLTSQIRQPMQLQVTILEPGSRRDPNALMTLILPYFSMMILYFNILMSSSILLSGLRSEMWNRILEILLTSVSVRQLITGKIIGLGLVGLLQTSVWLGIGYILLQLNGRAYQFSDEFRLPATILVWGVIFFLLGYSLYASLMAGVGALTPDLQEAPLISTLIMLPLALPGLMFISFVYDPNGAVATALSLFPLTSPVGMMSRLAATNDVPIWQIILSACILLITTLVVIYLVSNAFRAKNLFVGQKFNFKRLLLVLIGKA